jgi:hypothetical protein
VAQLVEALRHKTEGPVLYFRWGPSKFSSDLIFLSTFTSNWVHSASNRNEYQGVSLWVKADGT